MVDPVFISTARMSVVLATGALGHAKLRKVKMAVLGRARTRLPCTVNTICGCTSSDHNVLTILERSGRVGTHDIVGGANLRIRDHAIHYSGIACCIDIILAALVGNDTSI